MTITDISLETLKQQSEIRVDLKAYREREEAGDAELFASMFRDRVAYDHAARKWYIWRGSFWERDRTKEVRQLASNRLAAEYLRAGADAQQAGNTDEAKAFTDRARALMKKQRVDNILDFAQSQPELKLTGDEWDTCPMTLGVNNGVIDLETGVLRNAEPSEYLRVHSPVDWMGLDHPAPHWDQFILGLFDGNTEMVQFVRRLFGYCLTGKTTEHRLPILHGEGRNGKSTLLEIVASVYGEGLSHTTQADALMDIKRDASGPQPFVYALRGKRLVWANESREGQRVNAGLIKQLTGGDSITTRTMFSDLVTFKPTHKVMLLTNHKPHISAEDQAMWDRVLLIPFELRFVDEPKAPGEYKRNPKILDLLRTESAGILAWLVRGCLAWQAEGLNPPAKVLAATEAYRQDEDTIGDFISDCLIVGEGMSATAKVIYKCYVEWAKESGTDPMSKTALGKRLRRRFGEFPRNNQGEVYRGVGVST